MIESHLNVPSEVLGVPELPAMDWKLAFSPHPASANQV
jgi:hypothetical protein